MKKRFVGAIALVGLALIVVGLALIRSYYKEQKGVDDVFALVFTCCFAGLACLAWVMHHYVPAELPVHERPPGHEADSWERTWSWIAKHGAIPATLIVTIVLGIVIGEVFGSESNGDDLTFHMAESARLADCIRQGDWDFWNPSANGGYATAYYYQVLPQLVSALPTAIFGSDYHLFFFQLSLWLPHVLGPFAAYRGARLLGAGPWQAFGAALCVGFLSGESKWGAGPWSTFGVGLYTQSWALAAFPLALGYGGKWITDGQKLGPAIAWGTFVGLCHPFGGVSLGLALFIGVLVHTVARREVWRSTILSFAVLAILVLLAAAIFKFGKGPTVYGLLAVGMAIMARAIIALTQIFTKRSTEDRWRADFWIVFGEPARLGVLGGLLAVATMPGWITMLVDYEGFGGFPHRVWDEVGPGFRLLGVWFIKGGLLDWGRYTVLTFALPFAIVLGRSKTLRWLWPCAFVFAFLLGVGPHMGKTTDDLIPPVRFLGAMQTVLAMGIGISLVTFGQYLWSVPGWVGKIALAITQSPLVTGAILFTIAAVTLLVRVLYLDDLVPAFGIAIVVAAAAIGGFGIFLIGRRGMSTEAWESHLDRAFGVRTALAAIAGVLLVTLTFKGVAAIHRRIYPLHTYNNGADRKEMHDVAKLFEPLPQGRKQSTNDAGSHWWNLLSYVYGRRPSLLQMGGGGLQASPNYDFLFTVRDEEKLAWVYDAPYVVLNKTSTQHPSAEIVASTEDHDIKKLRSNGLVSPVHVYGVLPPGPARAKTPTRAAAIAWLQDPYRPYANEVLAYSEQGDPRLADRGGLAHLLLWTAHVATSKDVWAPANAKVLRAWRQDSPGDAADIYAELDVTSPSTFVIRESWHPRWRAFLDGKPAQLRRVTPDFPAIDVPAGTHWIALRFERPWWAHASWLAWPGVALFGYAFERLLRWWKARRAT